MALAPGARLGPYEVTARIGGGGMGEVYRAIDTNLKRAVAIKVLPDAVADDPDRLARFQREAELLASLNHSSIAQIHGLEKSDGTIALVMELVEGPTLADHIAQGPIPVHEALRIAKQIAEGLDAAHTQGIVHRDLKPSNVKVRPDGTVKVLDFGLAKALEPRVAASERTSMLPTTTDPGRTRAGLILGTAAYMSPEQARGERVDKRTDLWAFGCVLYEALTGKRAFEGEGASDTLASVLARQPDWNALPPNLPAAIRTLLTICLEKDREARIMDIAVARFLMSERAIIAGAAGPQSAITRAPIWWRTLPWAVASASAVALMVVSAKWAPWRGASPIRPLRMEVALGADASLGNTASGATATLSPDGQTLAFVAQKGDGTSQLFVRRLDQLNATPLAGTDGARCPFFSPDGQWIAFFTSSHLKKVSVTGGAPVTLCEISDARGGDWADDTIVLQPLGSAGANLMSVSSAGGIPAPLTRLAEGEATQRWPQLLPGGGAVLFTSHRAPGAGYEDANVVVQPLPSGAPKILQPGGYYARYVPSGHLVYMHDGTLFAAPFNLDRLQTTGPPVPAFDGIASEVRSGAAQFAVSGNGILVYMPKDNAGLDAPISWLYRTGKIAPLRPAAARWSNPRFSPDGRQLAIDMGERASLDVWVYDWMRDSLSRLTSDPGEDRKPVWTPDGQRIVFASARGDRSTLNLYWQRADGTATVQRLTESKNQQWPASWHPSGRFLAFQELNLQTGADLMILPIEGDEASGWKPGKATVFLNGPVGEREPMFSPDGRWLAYDSIETGTREVYVRPFPGPGGKWQISTGGGADATWSRARPELLYQAPDQRIMVVPYAVQGHSFRAEKPRLWSEMRLLLRPRQRSFDLHPDGDRLALAAPRDSQTAVKRDTLVFIFDFLDELRRIAPAKE